MPRRPTPSSSLSHFLTPDTKVTTSATLATLWASYGSILSLTATHPTLLPTPTKLVLKTISPPPHASSDDESHLRKLISYHVERYFYSALAPQLEGRGVKVARSFPELLLPQREGNTGVLLLEDLGPAGYPQPAGHVLSSITGVKAVLTWLARFHATFMGKVDEHHLIPPPLEADLDRIDKGIWANGSYWYLATRQDEYRDMLESGEVEWLEPWVEEVDRLLHDPGAKGRTVLHGDCKAANIVFSASGTECALYDLQYCGAGVGVVDLVYFLGTSVSGRLLEGGGDEELVGFYAEEVRRAGGLVEEGVIREQFEWAVVDWMRFMGGGGGVGEWEVG
ncbi:hypothetical protein BJ508DRAFT_48094 [Ascobolus immersus RN42]|uniref:Aminoglycoside phosphotransferase domain-containing protein n=1 Tax=Ascobolus immersus RN42 TaxID=1160509 RepID=A0A3N4HJX1_ASCIM|nr:hypothetical protein BJ508DRAFT_48094 [Ascobolus immersus RN42]